MDRLSILENKVNRLSQKICCLQQDDGGGASLRFGFSGEDDSAGEERAFDANNQDFSINGAQSFNFGTVVDGGDNTSSLELTSANGIISTENQANNSLASFKTEDTFALGKYDNGAGSITGITLSATSALINSTDGTNITSITCESATGILTVKGTTVAGDNYLILQDIAGDGNAALWTSGGSFISAITGEIALILGDTGYGIDITSNRCQVTSLYTYILGLATNTGAQDYDGVTYNASQSDFHIFFSGGGTTATTVNIDNDDISQGAIIIISDQDGKAAVHNITIDAGSGNTITSLAGPAQTYVLGVNYASVTLQKLDADHWRII